MRDSFNYNVDFTAKCIDANEHNQVTTCYYLLMRKRVVAGGASVADINAEDFDSSVIAPYYKNAKRKLRA